MASSSPIDEALRRLGSAVELLESAIERRLEDAREVDSLEGELHRLGSDRSRLAQTLDGAEARSAQLKETNREVSRRLVGAMESIREVLARHGA